MAKGSMRELMPKVAAVIDEWRLVLGAEVVESIIRAGMGGQPVFFASENGHTVGTPIEHGVRVGTDGRGNRYLIDGPIAGEPDWNESKFDARERREKLKGANAWGR